jgi:ABC-type Zn2+ transport system substrate-binding protein/surface adhesin
MTEYNIETRTAREEERTTDDEEGIGNRNRMKTHDEATTEKKTDEHKHSTLLKHLHAAPVQYSAEAWLSLSATGSDADTTDACCRQLMMQDALPR